MPDVEVARGHVGDVPVFLADGPPPFVGSLVFRVGRADETAATGGITHLVEHLALPVTGRRAVVFNGSVDNILTTFVAAGDADLVLPFLRDAAARLRALPLERLETERNVLLAEESLQGPNPTRLAYALRFGPHHHGLTGYDEYGLRSLRADDVAAWARERFVAGNAAAWVTGPAEALELELSPGERLRPPEPTQLADLPWPCFYAEGPFGVLALSLLARRSIAFSAALSILEHRIEERVRYELGYSYSPEALFMPLTKDLVHVVLVVDTMAVNTDRVLDETLAVVDALATHGPTEEELDDERRFAARRLADPTEIGAHLFYAAAQHLLGAEFEQPAELEHARAALTGADVVEGLRPALDSLLVIAPPDTQQPSRLAAYPLTSSEVVAGKVYRPRGRALRRSLRPELVVGPDGVSIRHEERRLTARFDDSPLVLRSPDGSRTLVSADGFFVSVEPTVWRSGREIIRAIDEAVPSERVVCLEPELTARVESVEQVAQESLRRRWLVSDELARLPERLDAGEEPLAFLSCAVGWRAGLLVATDRRLVFLSIILKERWREWPYEDVDRIQARPGLWRTKVGLATRDEEVVFSDVKRRDAERFAAVVRERLRGSAV